jgi:transcription-repair coupling factor (superfamily II helicase)
MTEFIETSPDAFPVITVDLFNKYGRLIVEMPNFKDASALFSALSAFRLKTLLFAPQFLLLERSGEEGDAQKAYAGMSANPDVIVTTPLGGRLFLPDNSAELNFKKNSYYKISDVAKSLAGLGYRKVQIVRDAGEFAVRGDIVDIGVFITGKGVRLEFFDEELENISLFWLSNQRNGKMLDEVSIPQLMFPEILRNDWQKVLEEKGEGLSTQQLLETEELVSSGTLPKWDIFPLIAGDGTIYSRFKAKTVRFEKLKAETYVEDDFNKIDTERKKRIEEGHFIPFEIKSCFSNEKREFDIEVSSFFSSAETIEKFLVTHKAVPQRLQGDPAFVINKLFKENGSLVVFVKPNEIDVLKEIGEKNDIPIVEIDSLPLKLDYDNVFLVDKKEWFAPDEIISLPDFGTAFLSSEIFKLSVSKNKKREVKHEEYFENRIFELNSLKSGEFVVHYKFGIGVYEGTSVVNGTDCLVLRYENDDRVYIPVYNMHYIYRYRWEEGVFPKISSIRNALWQQTMNRVQREIEKVAAAILELYAQRSVERAESMKVDTPLYYEFLRDFPFRETPDQARSIHELEADLAGHEITDRLLCGDVGFGKTEVAMRGCMIAVANGKQAAVLAPTTVLAFQHLRTFQERFAKLPVRIEMLSRLYDKSKQKQILNDLENGRIDILVGTHRLLGKDVKFRDLGFLVIDEEHRFGVTHKEQIKEMKRDVATLSMTATPIPRTLQMSLLGIRKSSFIKTAPSDRKNIQTFVLEYSEEIIKDAILAELARDGQVYFVHNRVAGLNDIKLRLTQLIPNLRIAVAHGQMEPEQLEKVMVSFVNRDYDLLLATSLIESGIDIPLVNTIIINRADMFGMAQLYQLRGRVGRWNREAKAYLFVPNLNSLTQESFARLSTIKRFDKLGHGYDVAMEDLNIRGGGNILGISQSGKLKGVGYDMYLEMLKNRIDELKNGIPHIENDFEISTDLNATIPESYIADTEVRMGFYRKIADLRSLDELDWVCDTMTEMFGKIPDETENLINLTKIKILAVNCGAAAVSVGAGSFTLTLGTTFIPKSMDALFELLEKHGGSFQGESAIRFKVGSTSEIEEIINKISEIKQ